MDEIIEKQVGEIVKEVAQLISDSKLKMNGTPQDIIRRTNLQMGVLDEIGIDYSFNNSLKIQTSSLEKKFTITSSSEISKEVFQQQFQPLLIHELTKLFDHFQDDPVLNFKVAVQLAYPEKLGVPADPFSVLFVYVNEKKRIRLLENNEAFIIEKVFGSNWPTKEIDNHFLVSNLFDLVLYPVFDVQRMIQVIERLMVINKPNAKTSQTLVHHIAYIMKQWGDIDFLPSYYLCEDDSWGIGSFFLIYGNKSIANRKDNVPICSEDIPILELLVYAGIFILRYEPNYSRHKGLEYLKYAQELGYTQVKNMLKYGSGNIAKVYTQYENEFVACLANDVMATIDIKMKQESAETYLQALEFLIQLLKQDFPRSYAIHLHSKVKCFLPIPKIGKTRTHQFFANALQYPETYKMLEIYARIAIREFEWYTDAENEFCAMPGTYAVFGLCLSDLQYLSLLDDYISQMDEEHQSVQQYFIKAFIEKWGVTAQTIKSCVNSILKSVNSLDYWKLDSYFETVTAMDLLLEAVRPYEKHEIDDFIYCVWGGREKLARRAKKASPELKIFMESLLAI